MLALELVLKMPMKTLGHDEVCADMGHPLMEDIGSFAQLFLRLAVASGDKAELEQVGEEYLLHQTSWRFGAGLNLPPEGFEAWNGIWEGFAAVHETSQRLNVMPVRRMDLGDDAFTWRIFVG